MVVLASLGESNPYLRFGLKIENKKLVCKWDRINLVMVLFFGSSEQIAHISFGGNNGGGDPENIPPPHPHSLDIFIHLFPSSLLFSAP